MFVINNNQNMIDSSTKKPTGHALEYFFVKLHVLDDYIDN